MFVGGIDLHASEFACSPYGDVALLLKNFYSAGVHGGANLRGERYYLSLLVGQASPHIGHVRMIAQGLPSFSDSWRISKSNNSCFSSVSELESFYQLRLMLIGAK